MAWFRVGTNIAKHAIRRTLSQNGSSYLVARARVLPSSYSRGFHTTVYKSKEQAAPVPRAVPLSRLTDSFLDGTSSVYLEELQRAWEADPNSVDESWDNFFRNFVNGHMKAKLDPLNLEERVIPEDLDPALYGSLRLILIGSSFWGWRMSGFLSENRPVQTLRSILTRLEQAYCGSIGYEYMHIADREKCNWLRDKIETPTPTQFNRERREAIFDRLAWSSLFENFLATKWTSAKRFGLEGGETLIPGMKEMFDRASDLGVESIVMGMAHRGRLNVLGNVVRKPLRQIFGWQEDTLSLVANPSHLEAVNPVVVGKTRAKQYYSNDVDRIKNMGVLIHGDGSFAGQGVVYETLHLSALPNYSTGGTIHIVLNNQVAFTTDPTSGSVHACELAAEWRQTFHSDVVVDLVCYRRFGHNEIDEPSFTQPKMYKVIRSHPSALEIYQKKLVESGDLAQEDIDKIHNKVTSILNEEFLASKEYIPKRRDWLSAYWTGFKSPEQLSRIRNTGVKPEILKNVGKAITTIPENFTPHRAVKRIYEQRAQMIETGEDIDWGFAEALAFATLLVEGNHVRLSGQDVERGTFSHRHAVVHDQTTGDKYCPLDHVIMNQDEEMFTVSNRASQTVFASKAHFSELVFLDLNWATQWKIPIVDNLEAQFGDFANGAHVIFDNFLASGELSGSVRLACCVTPQWYDGQGPEHQVADWSAFFQMADDNPYVIPEIGSNSPKTDSGHPGFDKQGTRFKRLIKDQNDHSDVEEGIRRLVLCSGKCVVYYELDEHRTKVDAKMRRLLVQEEPMNMGGYTYILPRLVSSVKAVGRGGFDDVKYVGRAPSAASPVSSRFTRRSRLR
ncbi:Transketolase-like, pyrimidine-binding domain [Sesbania bispinosa]|nr:Transketolase-like, pyrimidine-binding domain [Sesbania bispinosa]